MAVGAVKKVSAHSPNGAMGLIHGDSGVVVMITAEIRVRMLSP